MTEDKFARSQEFLRVYGLLISAAERRELIGYKDVAYEMKLPPSGHVMGQKTGQILGEISRREAECGRPLLSVLCVSSQNHTPGPGFFALAIQLGLLSEDATDQEKSIYWKSERDRVYDVWKWEDRSSNKS